MNLKNLIKNRSFGFYVTLVLGLLMLITGILYTTNIKGDFGAYAHIPFNAWISVLLIVGSIIMIGMSLFDVTANYGHYVGGVAILTSLCLLIKDIYLFVMNCFVDIDYHIEDFYNPVFFVPLVLFVVIFILGIANCFFPQVKACKETEAKEEEIEVANNEK